MSPDALVHLFTSGAYLPFALLLFYFGLRLVKDETSWLNNGRVAVIAAAVLAGLTDLVPVLITGETPSLKLVASALGAAWALYISPHGAAPTALANTAAQLPRATVVKQGGFADVRVVAMIAIACVAAFAIGACSWLKSEAKTVETAAVDCTKGELGKAVTTYSPLVDKLLQLATGGDGKVDWSQVEDGTKQLAGDVGGCVVSTTIAKALQPSSAGSDAPKSSPLVIDPGDLRAHFEAMRAARFGGRTYLTEAGRL